MDDRGIGRHQMLAGAIEDRPHRQRHGRVFLLEAAKAAPALLHRPTILAHSVFPCRAPTEIAFRIEPRIANAAQRAMMRAVIGRVAVHDDIGRSVLVIERHLEEGRDARLRRDHARERQDEGHDAHAVAAIRALADRRIVEAEIGRLDRERRRVVVDRERAGIERVGIGREAVALPAGPRLIGMEDADMRAVEPALQQLKIVAVEIDTLDVAMARRRLDEREIREARHLVRRPEITPDQAAALAARIGHRAKPRLIRRIGIVRRIEQAPFDIELPAMIEAAYAAILDASERERRAAMGAKLVEEAEPPRAITEQHIGLAAELRAYRIAVGVLDLACQGDRRPIAAKHLSHRRFRFDAAEQLVLVLAHAGFPYLVTGSRYWGCVGSFTAMIVSITTFCSAPFTFSVFVT